MKDIIYTNEEGEYLEKIPKNNSHTLSEEEVGFILWKLETIENFFPVYKTMIKKE